MSMQENFGQGLESTGNFIFWSGMVGIGIMAVVGTLLMDVVVLVCLDKILKKVRKAMEMIVLITIHFIPLCFGVCSYLIEGHHMIAIMV
ncbi:MAG: hypothetical protein ACOYKA_00855 [Legionellaceae bacterium]